MIRCTRLVQTMIKHRAGTWTHSKSLPNNCPFRQTTRSATQIQQMKFPMTKPIHSRPTPTRSQVQQISVWTCFTTQRRICIALARTTCQKSTRINKTQLDPTALTSTTQAMPIVWRCRHTEQRKTHPPRNGILWLTTMWRRHMIWQSCRAKDSILQALEEAKRGKKEVPKLVESKTKDWILKKMTSSTCRRLIECTLWRRNKMKQKKPKSRPSAVCTIFSICPHTVRYKRTTFFHLIKRQRQRLAMTIAYL